MRKQPLNTPDFGEGEPRVTSLIPLKKFKVYLSDLVILADAPKLRLRLFSIAINYPILGSPTKHTFEKNMKRGWIILELSKTFYQLIL